MAPVQMLLLDYGMLRRNWPYNAL